EPDFPSLVAVIDAVPAPTAVTNPLPFTVATAAFELAHVIPRPVNTVPLASFVVAVPCVVCPTVRLDAFNATVTVATGTGGGALTVTAAVPVFPSLIAVIVAEPGATAVTRPLELTVAIPAALVDHVTVRPVSGTLFASNVVAPNWNVPPVI